MTTKLKTALLAAFLIILPAVVLTSCSKNHQPGEAASTPKAVRYNCPMHQSYVSDKPGSCPICGMDLVPMEEKKTKTMYRSTMNPKEVSDKPGKDSMGMEMEVFEVRGGTGAKKVEGLGTVTITPEKQKMLGVQSQAVIRKNIAKTIRTVGRIAHDPDLFYAEQEYITSLKTYETAKNLPQGQALDNAKSMVDASKYKLRMIGIGESQIEEIAKQDAPDNSLLLPEGDEKKIWVYASIYEDDLEFVKPGQNVAITVPTSKSQKFYGTIVSLEPVIDPATRSVRARIAAVNPYGMIEHRTYLDIEISVQLGNKLVVPANAVLDTGTRQVVFVDKGEGTLEPKEVKLGLKNDDYYIVKSGLAEGDKVVTNANFLIDSESQLKAVQ